MLAKSKVSFPFFKGLNEKQDDKMLEAPFLLKAENVRFEKGGAITKRYGFTSLASGSTTAGNLFSNGELALMTAQSTTNYVNGYFTAYGTSGFRSLAGKTCFPNFMSVQEVSRDFHQVDVARGSALIIGNSAYTLYVMHDKASNGTYISVVEDSYKSYLVRNQRIGTFNSDLTVYPFADVNGENFWAIIGVNNGLQCQTVKVNPTTGVVTVSNQNALDLVSPRNTDTISYDATKSSQGSSVLYVAYQDTQKRARVNSLSFSSGSSVAPYRVNDVSGATWMSASFPDGSQLEASGNCIAVYFDNANILSQRVVLMAVSQSANNTSPNCQTFTTALVQSTGPVPVADGTTHPGSILRMAIGPGLHSTDVRHIALLELLTGSAGILSGTRGVQICYLSASGEKVNSNNSIIDNFLPRAHILAKPTKYDLMPILALGYINDVRRDDGQLMTSLQQTGFIGTINRYESDGLKVRFEPIAKFSSAELAEDSGRNRETIFQYVSGALSLLYPVSPDAYFTKGVNQLRFDIEKDIAYPTNKRTYLNYDRANTLTNASGFLVSIDGQKAVEAIPHLYPEISVFSSSIGRNPLTSSESTFQMCMTFEYTDNHGVLHRSAPSLPQTYYLSGWSTSVSQIVKNQDFHVRFARPVFTAFDYSNTAQMEAVFYFTNCAESTFNEVYRIPLSSSQYSTNVIGDMVAVVPMVFSGNFFSADTVPKVIDLSLRGISNKNSTPPLLYTEGNVLTSDAPPLLNYLIATQGGSRIFGVSVENPNEVWYSKPVEEKVCPEFNSLLTFTVNDGVGPITALASLFDKVIIFKRNQMFIIDGDGPDATGNQGVFSYPRVISSEVGCINPASVVNGPFGIAFQSDRGIYIYSNGGTPTYISGPVEDSLGTDLVNSAVVLPANNEVRFSVYGTDKILVWNYLFDAWSIFYGNTVEDAVYTDRYIVKTSADVVKREDRTTFLDDSAWVSGSIQTSWIKRNPSDYNRFYRAQFLGTPQTNCVANVELFYDYLTSSFGSVYNFSSSVIQSGSRQKNQFEIHLPKQKCSTISFKLTDKPLPAFSGTTGQGMEWNAIDLIVGAKNGNNKIGSNKKE